MLEKKELGNVLKVVEMGLEKDVYAAIKKPGFSAEALARQFTADGKHITAQSIRKFVKKTKNAHNAIIEKDMALKNEVMELTMNYKEALNDILTEVKEVKNMAKDDKDYTTYNQLVGRLLQGIELFAKLTGDMKPKGNIDINIIYNEIATDVEKKILDLKNKFETVVDVDFEIDTEDEEAISKIRK